MIFIGAVALFVAVVVATLVANRNAERDFQPPFRAHLELFLAGVPAGFISMLLLKPEQAGIVYWAMGIGVLTGLGLSYSIPRQWRYAQEKGMFPKQKTK